VEVAKPIWRGKIAKPEIKELKSMVFLFNNWCFNIISERISQIRRLDRVRLSAEPPQDSA
jgi:hypothetical protein